MPRRKKRSKINLPSIFKKSSLSGLILLLMAAFFKMSGSLQEFPIVHQLPASEQAVALYSNQTQDDLSQIYLNAISSARQSVTMVIYSLLDQRIISALQAKCEEGIPVHVVCDAKASLGISRKLSGATIVKRIGQGLMHQKILIIDQQQILLGSANMTQDSLKIHGNLVMALDHGPLAEIMLGKVMSMDDEGNHIPLKHQEIQAEGQKVELWELPDDPQGASRIIQLLRSAKKSIKVAMFTFTRNDFAQELIEAKKRGLKVEVVVDRYAGKGSSAKVVKMLAEGGVPVQLSTGNGLLHHKFAYLDEEILINGSANWTLAAFKNNDDYFMVISPLNELQKSKLNQLWKIIWQRSSRI